MRYLTVSNTFDTWSEFKYSAPTSLVSSSKPIQTLYPNKFIGYNVW